MSEIVLVAAIAENNAIGKDNQLLWHLPEDLKRFKKITSGHIVVMGRKTFDSIGRPLPNRKNIVVTRNSEWTADGVEVCQSLDEAIELCGNEICMILGGAQIYEQSISIADRLEITHVHASFEGDTFFPAIDNSIFETVENEKGRDSKSGLEYTFSTWVKKPL